MQPCILYIEDNQNDILFLEFAFKEAGISHPLKVVRNGQRALEYLSGTGPFADREWNPLPCLILLDINLPEKSGFEVLEWIRQQPGIKSLPVLMLTASSHPKDIERTRRLAANDYVVKPLGFAEFVQLIKTMRDRWLMPPPAAPNRTKHVPARTMLNA